jgi:hypothetical protein
MTSAFAPVPLSHDETTGHGMGLAVFPASWLLWDFAGFMLPICRSFPEGLMSFIIKLRGDPWGSK